jgi:hypothetical protein
MRELTTSEIGFVSGGTGSCSTSGGGDTPNEHLGGASPNEVGGALIATYEGLVEAASHVIERVADALGD